MRRLSLRRAASFVLAPTVLRLSFPSSSGSTIEPNHRPSDFRWQREPSPFILHAAIVVRPHPHGSVSHASVSVAYTIAYLLAPGATTPDQKCSDLGFSVEAKGLEPSNLLTASQALYQLSYAPVAAQRHFFLRAILLK